MKITPLSYFGRYFWDWIAYKRQIRVKLGLRGKFGVYDRRGFAQPMTIHVGGKAAL